MSVPSSPKTRLVVFPIYFGYKNLVPLQDKNLDLHLSKCVVLSFLLTNNSHGVDSDSVGRMEMVTM